MIDRNAPQTSALKIGDKVVDPRWLRGSHPQCDELQRKHLV